MGDRERAGYLLTTDPGRVDVDRLHRWLCGDAYWALGRPREVVERSLAASRPYTVLHDGEQVAFARVVTDGATFAWVCDVYVDPAHRGRGLATWVVDSVVEDADRDGIGQLVLATRDAHGVYRRSGFVPVEGSSRWMEINRRAAAPA